MTEQQLYALLDQALPFSVFQMLAPQDTPEPYVIYSLVSGSPRNTMCGGAGASLMNYRIDSYARTHREALVIMDRVFALVDACEGDPIVESRQDIYEQDTRVHRVSVVLSTWYEPDEVQ